MLEAEKAALKGMKAVIEGVLSLIVDVLVELPKLANVVWPLVMAVADRVLGVVKSLKRDSY